MENILSLNFVYLLQWFFFLFKQHFQVEKVDSTNINICRCFEFWREHKIFKFENKKEIVTDAAKRKINKYFFSIIFQNFRLKSSRSYCSIKLNELRCDGLIKIILNATIQFYWIPSPPSNKK